MLWGVTGECRESMDILWINNRLRIDQRKTDFLRKRRLHCNKVRAVGGPVLGRPAKERDLGLQLRTELGRNRGKTED